MGVHTTEQGANDRAGEASTYSYYERSRRVPRRLKSEEWVLDLT